jgi:hypothetical protein
LEDDVDPKFLVGSTLPAHLGLCADLYREVRDLRIAMQKEVDEIKRRETEIREHIIDSLPKTHGAAKGQFYRAEITTSREIKVSDWPTLHGWIIDNRRMDMLQKRLSETAAKDWVEENGRPLPGTEIINVPDVSITKL